MGKAPPLPTPIEPFGLCAPVCGTLLRGDELKGDQFNVSALGATSNIDKTALDSLGASGNDEGHRMIIQPLLGKCVNVHGLMLEELGRFRAIPEKNWRFPPGYRTRIAPAYWG